MLQAYFAHVDKVIHDSIALVTNTTVPTPSKLMHHTKRRGTTQALHGGSIVLEAFFPWELGAEAGFPPCATEVAELGSAGACWNDWLADVQIGVPAQGQTY